MAEAGQERTEQATEKRLEEALHKGQVPYSREITAAILLLVTLGALRVQGAGVTESLAGNLRSALSLEDAARITPSGILPFLNGLHERTFAIVTPLLLLVLGAVAISGFLQVGFSLHLERLDVRWSRLNPLDGLKRICSSRSALMLLASIAKVAVVALIAWNTVDGLVKRAGMLSDQDTRAMMLLFVEAAFAIGFKVGGGIFAIAVIDLLYQRWRHKQDMMMSKEEVKEERRSGEGDPQIKGRIRQLQRDAARARLKQDVKKATVVVRNPTHYAVALGYVQGKDAAPRLLAKGRNLIALRIIEIAEKEGIPVRSDPPLARQIYRTVKVGRSIPEELFQAVAKVLAWVYRRRRPPPPRFEGPGARVSESETGR